jgi:hypothetical protein
VGGGHTDTALKKEAVPKLIAGQKVKLRDGAESFLRGILADGSVKLAVVAATASDPEDTVAECALAALGSELRGGILVFGSAASGARPPPESLEAQLAVYIQQQKTGPCTLRARWVTLRARWVTLRARWVALRARWVTLSSLGDVKSSLGDAELAG